MKLKVSIRPRFIMVSSLVVLLGISIILYGLKEKERGLRIVVQKNWENTVKERNLIQKALSQAVSAKRTITTELDQKKRELTFALDNLEKEMAARRKAETDLSAQTPPTIDLKEIVVQNGPGMTGKILKISDGNELVMVDLGKKNNLEAGTILAVYREESFKGNLRVESAQENFCLAAVLPNAKNVPFAENDKVKLGQ
jgi:hypothetical protein